MFRITYILFHFFLFYWQFFAIPFKKKIRYNVSKNHSDTIDVEKKAYENIQNLIGDEITNFMKLYFQN